VDHKRVNLCSTEPHYISASVINLVLTFFYHTHYLIVADNTGPMSMWILWRFILYWVCSVTIIMVTFFLAF